MKSRDEIIKEWLSEIDARFPDPGGWMSGEEIETLRRKRQDYKRIFGGRDLLNRLGISLGDINAALEVADDIRRLTQEKSK